MDKTTTKMGISIPPSAHGSLIVSTNNNLLQKIDRMASTYRMWPHLTLHAAEIENEAEVVNMLVINWILVSSLILPPVFSMTQ